MCQAHEPSTAGFMSSLEVTITSTNVSLRVQSLIGLSFTRSQHVCAGCRQSPYSATSSTSVLARHLRRKHGIIQHKPVPGQTMIDRMLSSTPPESAKDQANYELMQCFVVNSIPFSVLDSPEWKRTISSIQRASSDYATPCADTISGTILPEAVVDLKVYLREFRRTRSIAASITADGYRGLRGKTYLAVTQHTIEIGSTIQFQRGTYLLGCEEFDS